MKFHYNGRLLASPASIGLVRKWLIVTNTPALALTEPTRVEVLMKFHYKLLASPASIGLVYKWLLLRLEINYGRKKFYGTVPWKYLMLRLDRWACTHWQIINVWTSKRTSHLLNSGTGSSKLKIIMAWPKFLRKSKDLT